MITYAWDFPLLEVAPHLAGQTDVVVTIRWRFTGTDEYGNSAGECGVVSIPTEQDGEFTPFDELTQEQVEGWVAPRVAVAAMTARIAAKLRRKAPPLGLVPKPPPWSAPTP